MPQPSKPTVRLTIENPATLRAVEQWTTIARAIGMPDGTPVEVTVSHSLIASAPLDQLDVEP